MSTVDDIVTDVLDFFTKLEGPYKWYVLGIVLIILTALMTRVIFKTFKWFLIIAAVIVLTLAIIHYLTPWQVFPELGVSEGLSATLQPQPGDTTRGR